MEVEKLTEQLGLEVGRAAKTAHKLYATAPSGPQGAVVRRVKSQLFAVLGELRKVGWHG